MRMFVGNGNIRIEVKAGTRNRLNVYKAYEACATGKRVTHDKAIIRLLDREELYRQRLARLNKLALQHMHNAAWAKAADIMAGEIGEEME